MDIGNDASGALSLKPVIIAFFGIKLYKNEMPIKNLLASHANETKIILFNEIQYYFSAPNPFRKKAIYKI